jgi:hypothetical protein
VRACVCVCVCTCDLETSKMERPRPGLGCCATEKEVYSRSALSWDFTQCRMVVSYGRFGTTYRFYPQGSSSPSQNEQGASK